MSQINKIGVIGAGNMGSGIAQKIAQEGLNVVVVDIKAEYVERGLDIIKQLLGEGVERKIWAEWSRSGSASMDLLLSRGRIAMEKRDFAKAIEHLTALTDHAPDFAEGWNARATAFFNAGEYGLSIADIQRTLVLNPRHFGAMQGFGRIMEELGHESDALAAYQAAAAIHPQRQGLKEAIERLEKTVSGQDI